MNLKVKCEIRDVIYSRKKHEKTTSERRPNDVQATSNFCLGKATPHLMAQQHETPNLGTTLATLRTEGQKKPKRTIISPCSPCSPSKRNNMFRGASLSANHKEPWIHRRETQRPLQSLAGTSHCPFACGSQKWRRLPPNCHI